MKKKFSPVRLQTRCVVLIFLLLPLAGCQQQSDSSPATAADAATGQRAESPAKGGSGAGEISVEETTASAETASGENQESEQRASGNAAAESSSLAVARAASNDQDVLEISFDDLQLPIQADMVVRPFMITDRVKQFDGKRVRLSGFMLPDAKLKGITQFVLLKNTECKFGPGGQADHLVNVLMDEGHTTRFRSDAISVEGVLKINVFNGPDGNTWSIYDLHCNQVEAYRPHR